MARVVIFIFHVCVTERSEGKPTIIQGQRNFSKQSPLGNHCLLRSPFPVREASGHGPGFGHHAVGSGKKRDAVPG